MLATGLTAGGAFNWYDVVVCAALLYGVYSGIRAGLTGEIIRVVGLILMVFLAVKFHETVGNWIHEHTSLSEDLAQLLGFVSIAIVVYLITLVARLATRRWMLDFKATAIVENVGGGFAGAVRMALIMASITVILSLTAAGFVADQLGVKSRFGSFVLDQFPGVRAAVKKDLAGEHWSSEPKRRPELNLEDGDSTNKQSLEKNAK